MQILDWKGEGISPNIDRSTGAMPGQHNKAADKRKRLEDFYNNYKDDGSRSSRNAPIEVELAYQILSDSGKENPLYFKKLIREVIDVMHKTVQNEAAAISEIYTMINMDSRFQHIGDGLWGLTDWYPPETKRGGSKRTEKNTAKKPSLSSRAKSMADEETRSEIHEQAEKEAHTIMNA